MSSRLGLAFRFGAVRFGLIRFDSARRVLDRRLSTLCQLWRTQLVASASGTQQEPAERQASRFGPAAGGSNERRAYLLDRKSIFAPFVARLRCCARKGAAIVVARENQDYCATSDAANRRAKLTRQAKAYLITLRAAGGRRACDLHANPGCMQLRCRNVKQFPSLHFLPVL